MHTNLTVMIIGNGAREHALSIAYEKSEIVNRIIVTPGNDLIGYKRQKKVIVDKNSKLNNVNSILAMAHKYKPDIIDIAQDNALAIGSADILVEHGFKVFGPTRAAARIEWDKKWSREFMTKHNIKTPRYKIFSNSKDGEEYINQIYKEQEDKLVFIKASGLTGGKGALKSTNLNMALLNLQKMKKFGNAGSTYLVEEGLIGDEFSFFAISDGENYLVFNSAQDHKRLLDHDQGPQTGGMGALSPSLITRGREKEIENKFIKPVIEGMSSNGTPYVGILYFSGILTKNGIYCIEYNARWGDPECQVVIPSLKIDYGILIQKAITKNLSGFNLDKDQLTRVCVVVSSRGYPNDLDEFRNKQFMLLDEISNLISKFGLKIKIYGASIKISNSYLLINGGRLLNIMSQGSDIKSARNLVYSILHEIKFLNDPQTGIENITYRNDIGLKEETYYSQPDRYPLVIIDYGGQYTNLIKRRIRDFEVNTTVIQYYKIDKYDFSFCKGIILSGGPKTVGDHDSPKLGEILTKIIKEKQIPVLGICYGHQLLAEYFGGKLKQSTSREYGSTLLMTNSNSILLKDLGNFTTWMSHGDHVQQISGNLIKVASTASCPVAAMESSDGFVFGLQFHPEVSHTENGDLILKRFVKSVCQIQSTSWSMQNYKNELIDEIHELVGESKVIIGVSGGVDSLVTSILLQKAIQDNLFPIFIDHGLLRKGEVNQVKSFYKNTLKMKNFRCIDVQQYFIEKLRNITDPEKKRKIIGHTFIEVFEQASMELNNEGINIQFLAQGTIYTDRIESGVTGSRSTTIKSHHNLSLPKKMKLRIIEPLKELYKDEVRELGMILNAPTKLLNRYPFPGPGLAIRIIGEVTKKKINILQEADNIFMSELANSEFAKEVWQAFAVLLEGKAVGVQGDNRVYGRIICLRAVSSRDGMTANFSSLSWNFLRHVSSKIINNIPEVTRVLYDISTKPPATIEFE